MELPICTAVICISAFFICRALFGHLKRLTALDERLRSVSRDLDRQRIILHLLEKKIITEERELDGVRKAFKSFQSEVVELDKKIERTFLK